MRNRTDDFAPWRKTRQRAFLSQYGPLCHIEALMMPVNAVRKTASTARRSMIADVKKILQRLPHLCSTPGCQSGSAHKKQRSLGGMQTPRLPGFAVSNTEVAWRS